MQRPQEKLTVLEHALRPFFLGVPPKVYAEKHHELGLIDLMTTYKRFAARFDGHDGFRFDTPPTPRGMGTGIVSSLEQHYRLGDRVMIRMVSATQPVEAPAWVPQQACTMLLEKSYHADFTATLRNGLYAPLLPQERVFRALLEWVFGDASRLSEDIRVGYPLLAPGVRKDVAEQMLGTLALHTTLTYAALHLQEPNLPILTLLAKEMAENLPHAVILGPRVGTRIDPPNDLLALRS